jgi:hypothetical protein
VAERKAEGRDRRGAVQPLADPRHGLHGELAWFERAEALADWTLARLVNRLDVYGGYRSDRQIGRIFIGNDGKRQRLGATTTHKHLTRERIVRHYRGTKRTDIIGTHAAAPDNATLWGGWDFDNKNKDKRIHWKNSKVAKALYASLAKDGFQPLLAKSGGGSYHLRVLFRTRVPGDALHGFLKRRGVDAEVFPKSADVRAAPKHIGNWLRLPGRHHNRDYWSKVWDGKRWLKGHEAVDFIVALSGDDPQLLGITLPATPEEDITAPPRKADQKRRHRGGAQRGPTGYASTTSTAYTFSTPEVENRLRGLAESVQPEKEGQRRAAMRGLVRAVMEICPDLPETAQAVVFDWWFAKARRVVREKDRDLNLAEFMALYAGCKGGLNWLKLADGAKDEPLPPGVDDRTLLPATARLLRTLAAAQRHVGPEPFFLSYEDATLVMTGKRRSKMTAWHTLARFERRGWIRTVKKGRRRRKGQKRRATSYLYMPMWPDGEF